VRSLWHRYGGHFGGHRYALTGNAAPGGADQAARADDKPGIVALAHKHLPSRGQFPAAVMLPWLATDQGNGASGGMGAGILGRQYDPLLVEVERNALDGRGNFTTAARSGPLFRVPEFSLQAGVTSERFDSRQRLLQHFESQRRDMLESADLVEMDGFYRQAFDLLTSTRIMEGFDISQEPHPLRERYGLNAFGQSCLLARRLIERGSRFVQVNFSRFVTQNGYGWDTHGNGRDTLKNALLPKLNAGLSALLIDLETRGLLQETLVVAMGEFGRTPRVKPDGGRDHHAGCYPALLAGGGVHAGLVYGQSDAQGTRPRESPVEARDLLVTILTLLGVPTEVREPQGRVVPLFPGAAPVERLYA
jgi:hypothetical protein